MHWLVYHALGRLYDRFKAYEDPEGQLAQAIRRIAPVDGADVVDIGCGTGLLSRALAGHAKSVHGYDRSRHMVRVARRLSVRAGLTNCLFAVADHRRIPLAASAADVVVAAWTLLSLVSETWQGDWRAELDKCILESRRILKTTGTMVVVETANILEELPPGEVWHPQRRAFLEYLEQRHGFRNTHIRREWQYPSLSAAIRLTRLFYGRPIAQAIRRNGSQSIPESVGIWWLPNADVIAGRTV